MNLQVSGLHVDVGDSLRNHCEESIKSLQNYLPEIVDVNVALSKEKHKDKAEIRVHASHIHLRAEADGTDYFQAVDNGISKLLRQLEKYKGRIQKSRSRVSKEDLQVQIAQATHSKVDESSFEKEEFAADITHKNVTTVSTLTVDEAVMQMDLLHSTVYVFVNADTNELNVVNREEDGSIGWIELGKITTKN